MPDEDQLFLRPRQPPTYDERHPLGSDLEFIMRRIAALPTQCELIRFGVWVALGLCVVALAGPANVGPLHCGMQLELNR